MKASTKTLALLLTGAAGLTLQGCGARPPRLPTRDPVTTLPGSYRARSPGEPPAPASGPADAPPGSASGDENAALIEWEDFFSDPHLLKLIETAVANNKEVHIMMQRITAARTEIQARRGEYLPFVRIGAEAGTEKVGEHTRAGAVERGLTLPGGEPFPEWLGEYRFGLSSTWEIDAWRKLRNAKKAAVFEYMATEEGKNFLVTNLVAEVARAYYELMALDNQLETLSQYITLQRDGLEMVRELKAYARSNTLAVNRYQAEVAKNLARTFSIEQQITVVENQLNLLLGRTPRPIARSSDDFLESRPAALATGVPSELLRNRPDIRRAELELKAAELNIRVARANFYPRLELRAGVGLESSTLDHLFTTPGSLAGSLLGGMIAPLVNKNEIQARYESANARQVQAAYEYEQRILNAFTEVANELSNIDNLAQSLQRKEEQVELLIESIEVATQLFRSARAEYLEVLLTQREALEAKSELIETKQNQFVAMVDLYKALGGGWRRPPEDAPEVPGSAGA